MTYTKHGASPRATAWEAAGLDWLRVDDAAAVVGVTAVDGDLLVLQQLSPVTPTAADAEDFGRALATTHAAGASAYGVGPAGWEGDGYQGPADDLLPLPLRPYQSWGAMYADLCVEPLLDHLAGRVAAGGAKRGKSPLAGRVAAGGAQRGKSRIETETESLAGPVLRRLRGGEFDESCAAPARLHGDLWSGNVIWTAGGAVLIDPAAHGGHPESDLAALSLFGAPHLQRILASYEEVAPWADGRRERVPLLQLHLVLLHAVLFGGGYVEQAERIMRRYA